LFSFLTLQGVELNLSPGALYRRSPEFEGFVAHGATYEGEGSVCGGVKGPL